jgi:hypothetical protein
VVALGETTTRKVAEALAGAVMDQMELAGLDSLKQDQVVEPVAALAVTAVQAL